MSEASHSRVAETEYSEETNLPVERTTYKSLKDGSPETEEPNFGLITAFENLTTEFSSTGQIARENVGEWHAQPDSSLDSARMPLSTSGITTITSLNTAYGSDSVRTRKASPLGLLPRSQRVWELNRHASECRRCYRRFNFLIRRHHCRRCGQVVCDKCSLHRIRLPAEEIVEDPVISSSQYTFLASQSQRVCDACIREPIRRTSESYYRKYRSHPYAYGQMQRSNSSQSLMIDCPVCGTSFLTMQKRDQEDHLQQCLNVGSPPVQSPRYIVYELASDSTQIGDECPICFDEFEKGAKISRMICLCSYHQHCLASWLQRGRGCPVHYDFLAQNEE
ncbi:unnamed protein product [Rhizopus stolonifer]